MLRAGALLALAVAAAAASETVRTEAAGLRFAVPREWTRVPAPSDVRAAQYRIPRAAGDSGDTELILFFFGKAKGGSVQENLDRWYAQFTRPDGRPSRDAAILTIRTVKGLRVTAVDVTGTYLGAAPGGPRPDSRMLAAVVEGEDGPWFFKAVGPQATIAAAQAGFEQMLSSLEAHR